MMDTQALETASRRYRAQIHCLAPDSEDLAGSISTELQHLIRHPNCIHLQRSQPVLLIPAKPGSYLGLHYVPKPSYKTIT